MNLALKFATKFKTDGGVCKYLDISYNNNKTF